MLLDRLSASTLLVVDFECTGHREAIAQQDMGSIPSPRACESYKEGEEYGRRILLKHLQPQADLKDQIVSHSRTQDVV